MPEVSENRQCNLSHKCRTVSFPDSQIFCKCSKVLQNHFKFEVLISLLNITKFLIFFCQAEIVKYLNIEKFKIEQILKIPLHFLFLGVYSNTVICIVTELNMKGLRVKTGSPNPIPPALVCLLHHLMVYDYQ